MGILMTKQIPLCYLLKKFAHLLILRILTIKRAYLLSISTDLLLLKSRYTFIKSLLSTAVPFRAADSVYLDPWSATLLIFK